MILFRLYIFTIGESRALRIQFLKLSFGRGTATFFNVSASNNPEHTKERSTILFATSILKIYYVASFMSSTWTCSTTTRQGLTPRIQCGKVPDDRNFLYQTNAAPNKPPECGNYLWANQVSLLELFADHSTS